MPEPSQSITERESGIRTAGQAAIVTAVLVSIPALTVLFMFLVMSLFLHTRRDGVTQRHESYVARSIETLPGQNGAWWVDDPHVYFLTPPVRESLANQLPVLRDKRILPSTAFETAGQASFSYHRQLGTLASQSLDKLQGVVDQATLADKFVQTQSPFGTIGTLEVLWDEMPRSRKAVDLHLRAVIAHKLGNLWKRDKADDQESKDSKRLDEQRNSPGMSSGGREVETVENANPMQMPNANIRPESKQQWYATARRDYDEALEQYYRNPYHNRSLLALCHSDRARLYRDQGQRSRAALEYLRSREIMAPDANGSADALDSSIDCLCQAALAYRADGRYGLARKQLETALEQIGLSAHLEDIDVSNSTERAAGTAYVLERLGWINMDVWRISQAKACFQAARTLRSHEQHFPSMSTSIETQISVLQNGHGIAMASRYAGKTKQAANQYAITLNELFQLLTSTSHGGFHVEPRRIQQIFAARGIATELGDEPHQFEDARQSEHLLVNQMLNSLERYADCFLYGWFSWDNLQIDEPAFTLETVQRILNSDPFVDRSESETLARVLCKLSLDLVRRREFERAKRILAEVDKTYPEKHHSEKFTFLRDVSRACIPDEEGRYGDRLAQVLEDGFARLSTRGKFTRDELDLAIFAATLLFREGASAKEQYAALIFKLALYPVEHSMAADESHGHDNQESEITRYFRGPFAASVRHCLLAFPPNVNLALELTNFLVRMEAAFGNVTEMDEFFSPKRRAD